MDDRRNEQNGNRSSAGETARELFAQSLYGLVRLTRLGFQAAASGFERLEETMARRQEGQAERKPMGEAPPPPEKPEPTNDAPERTSDRSAQDPSQKRH